MIQLIMIEKFFMSYSLDKSVTIFLIKLILGTSCEFCYIFEAFVSWISLSIFTNSSRISGDISI